MGFCPALDLILVEKKKETITESAGRQQKKKIGKNHQTKWQSLVLLCKRKQGRNDLCCVVMQ